MPISAVHAHSPASVVRMRPAAHQSDKDIADSDTAMEQSRVSTRLVPAPISLVGGVAGVVTYPRQSHRLTSSSPSSPSPQPKHHRPRVRCRGGPAHLQISAGRLGAARLGPGPRLLSTTCSSSATSSSTSFWVRIVKTANSLPVRGAPPPRANPGCARPARHKTAGRDLADSVFARSYSNQDKACRAVFPVYSHTCWTVMATRNRGVSS